ncbi:MAG: hypothetical protein H0X04_03090 [Chthoniobacterales bacterium]|nr:hypothetical protein [Chthoniobacterales bacterium]
MFSSISGRIILRLRMARAFDRRGHAARFWHRACARGPPLALPGAIAVRLLGLIVQKDVLSWKRQVDAVSQQLAFDGGQNLIA